jgi:hypothetical protein
VKPHVCFEIRLFSKTFLADLADERLGTQMRIHVNFQSFSSLKSLGAKFTLVWLLTCVDHDVSFKLTSGAEGLEAGDLLTLERFFSGVI